MTVSAPKSGWRLEARAAAVERFAERHQVWILAIWSLIYFAGTMLRAHGKPFWYDEILTLLEARQPTLSDAMRALGDIDWMPPANHLIFYFWHKLAGGGEAAFRIPVMIAFWVFCVSLYFFARRRVSVFFAFMAMLLPFASAFQSYSYEARGYAFMLGFCGIALVSWQAAHQRTKRFWPLLGLAVGIAGAISFQYWSVLIYLPLAGAEAYRSIKTRRIDWPIWIAFAAGGLGLVAFLFVILHGLRSWSAYSGMLAHPTDYVAFYTIGFRVWFAFAVPAVLLLAAWLVCRGYKESPEGTRSTAIPDYEWVAAAILLFAIPVAVVSIALLMPPHSFSARYAAPAVAGYALLGSFLAARFAGQRSSIGLICTLAALAPFLYLMATPRPHRNPFRQVPGLQRQVQSGPVAFENPVYFLKLWYYAPNRLKPQLILLRAIEPERKRTVPFGEFAKVGVPVVRYDDFALPGREFLFYTDVGRRFRLKDRIEHDGGTVDVLSTKGRHLLMRAHIK